jgi:hypothetical protein
LGQPGVLRILALCLATSALAAMAGAQAVITTTVQGTVYLANGQPGAGTLVVSWPAFTTAAGQAIVADSTTVTIAPDGFVSVNLAPNIGAVPAGEYYTAVLYLSDGSTSTQYWVVPAAAQATLAQVQSQVMPAAQAVQTVSKAYVDQSISELNQSLLAASGGNLSGPLYLNADPSQPLQAADKHYVDAQVATALPLSGGTLSGSLNATQIGAVYQADQFAGVDFGAKLQACLNALNTTYGGTCDARNFAGSQTMGSNLTISTGNAAVLLPCTTITTANQVVVAAGTRNVALHGCAMRGGSTTSGSQGGTVFAYSGSGAMLQVGDPTYATDTPGFHLDNLMINTTGAPSGAQGLIAYRTQEIDLESLYLLGNANQTGMTLDGTGNYTGGTFLDDQFVGFGTAVNAIGHQISNPATTDWMNASTFVRLHINCPMSNGSPISGTYGINLQQGDGNSFTGGDVEGCAIALHLGPNAQNNTIVGLRNENSTNQVVADAGSAYNNWITGGTLFTGKLADSGTRNSFLDTFHRSFNGLNGDWYGSQQDATVTNHFRLGTGAGNERGLLNRYQTDYGYRWTTGLTDAAAGEQFYQVLDEMNNVNRLSIGQYNNGQPSTNNQTALNSAGTGAVVLNGSNNAGTGGVIIGSGGPSETTVAAISNAGNAQFNGTLQVSGTSQSAGTMTVRNNADAEVDYYLWPGLSTSQKGSFTYKDWNGNSQWYMLKDASNNWALNSATGGMDSFKAYQSANSGDTYVNASNSNGHIRLNYETGSGAETDIYSGSSANLDAAFLGPTSIKFPGLAASSGHSCLQVDSSGYLTNTGVACGSGSGGSNGTINTGNTGQIAYYTASGTSLGGMNAVPLTSGGTGATTASGALANLGGEQTIPVTAYGAMGDCTPSGPVANCTDNTAAIQSAIDAAFAIGGALFLPFNPANRTASTVYYVASSLNPKGVSIYGPPGAAGQSMAYVTAMSVAVRGAPGKDVFDVPDPGASAPGILKGFSVRDLGIIVDDTVNASANFPNRFPGRTCFDAVANGTTVITSATQCQFQPGDVGQAMLVNSVSTTIASWQSANQVTLAAPVSSGSSLTAYVSVVGLPVTQTVGNCGFAMDASGLAGGYGNGPLRADFTNVVIQNIAGRQNYTCGFFFQGNAGPYQTKWDHDFVGGNFGFVFVPANTTAGQPGYACQGMCDFNEVDNTWVSAVYPWISYGGNADSIKAMQISGATYGPQILIGNGAGGAAETDLPSTWHIDIPEMEGTQACSGGAAPTTLRVAGHLHVGERISTIYCGSGTAPTLQWDASESTISELDMAGVGTLAISGNHNTFTNPSYPVALPTSYSITGIGNQLITCTSSNEPYGQQPARCQYAGLSGSTFGPPQLARGSVVFNRTHDFIEKGAGAYYFDDEDLWFWPNEVMNPYGTVNVISDSSSVTGSAISIVGTNSYSLYGSNGTAWFYGEQIPADKVRFYVMAKANTSLPWSASLASYSSGTGYNTLCTVSAPLTTSYAVYECDGDATVYPGTATYMSLGSAGTGNTVSVAWIAIRPWPSDENVNGPVNATGFQVGGAPFGTVNLADWTNTGITNGYIPIWNSTTNKWTPGVVNAAQVNGGAVPASVNVLATNSSSQPITATAHNLSAPRTCPTTNSGNAYICTTSPIFIPTVGDVVSVDFNAANTASATLAVNGGSAYTIYKNAGTQTLTSGDLQPNHWVSAILDSNNHWQIEGQLGNVNATQINGSSTPVSTAALGTNSSGQLVSMPVPTVTAVASTTSTSLASTGLVLPSVPTGTTVHGTCAIIWEGSSTSYATTFGLGANNAPTNLWVIGTMHSGANGGTQADKYTNITNATATAVTTAGTPGAASTGYRVEIDFTLVTGSNPVTLTLYYQSSSSSGTSYVEPGSACWLM